VRRFLRTAVVSGVIAAVVTTLAPPALAAVTLSSGDYLQQRYIENQPSGTGTRYIKNSSGTIIGSYKLKAVAVTPGRMRVDEICVYDELGNGRGVVLRVMVKYATNSSKDLGYFKDRSTCYTNIEVETSPSIWGLDVDHGEAWGSVTYQYTGYYDRYKKWDGTYTLWPCFD
jgi:hypothetical protein